MSHIYVGSLVPHLTSIMQQPTTSTAPVTLSSVLAWQSSFQSHPHHLTLESPWPILTSGAVLAMLSSSALYFNSLQGAGTLLVLGLISTTSAMTLWWGDCVTEGTYLGHHTKIVQHSLSLGVSLFIVTEACAFLSAFWAYFHSSLAPTVELGTQWPPVGVTALSPMAVPLMNTLLLVSSGATITYGHHAIFQKSRPRALMGVALTVFLAIIFTVMQGLEYDVAGFTMSDGAYGTVFFATTGLHGFHVLIGTIALAVGLVRTMLYHFTSTHHIGLEASILYWHFVDVVWLFLYMAVYWWGAA
jgi:cytochrome c oxidase subunit 3